MCNPHRRVGRIDVLSALSTRPIGIDPKVIGLDVDHDRVIDLRRNKHTCETRMPPLRLVERRNPYQPMHTRLSTQQAKRKLSGDGKRRRLDSSLIPVLNFIDFSPETLPFRPAQIHPHQHLGPVLALSSACPRMHCHDGIQRVVFFRQHCARFKRFREPHQRIDFTLQIRFDRRFPLAHQFEISLDVVAPTRQFRVIRKLVL